MKYPIILQI